MRGWACLGLELNDSITVLVGAGCILCCLSCYVLILRRLGPCFLHCYARYMVLEEPQVNGVAPSGIGVPDSPDPDWK